MDDVFVYETEKAVVRIHSGKLTEEQRKEVLTRAAQEFYLAIQKDKAQPKRQH